jgi:hypothetical protein
MPAQIVRLQPHLLRAAHLRVLVAAVDQAQMAFDDVEVLVAAGRFFSREPFSSADALQIWLDEHDAHAQFLPWLLWDAHGDVEPPARKGARAQDDLTRRLNRQFRSGPEKTVLKALRATRPDVYAVVSVEGKTTTMERLRDRAQVVVHEPVLRSMAAVGEVFVARVVEVGGLHLLDAVHASMPAVCRPAMLRVAKRLDGLPSEWRLPTLLKAAARSIDRMRPPTPSPFGAAPRSTGPAGRMRWTMVFAVDDTVRVQEALRRLTADGRLARLSPQRFALLDTTLGPVGATLRLAGGRFFAATSVPGGVNHLRTGLAPLIGLQPQATLVRDLEPLFDARRRNEWSSNELQSVAREWMGECLTAFQDTAQPWLDGATPREAVRTADGRVRVKAWLSHVEVVGEVAGPGYNTAVQRLWRELADG